MNAKPSKTASFVNNLRASFSSGSQLSLSGKGPQNTQPVADQTTNNPLQQTISPEEQLDTLNQVIDQVEAERVQDDAISLGNVAQAMPQVMQNVPDPLNPPNPTPVGSQKKEAYVVGSGVAAETPAPTMEYAGGVQSVEQEKTPEISPEVESFLQKAEQQPDHLPQEIVIADDQAVSAVTHHPKTPVVVLPITPEEQKAGEKKSPKLSIRWLVEWSVKIMKKFSGKVIYREQ